MNFAEIPLCGRDGEEVPLAGYALELVSPAIVELEPRSDHEVAQRAGDEHVVRPGQCAHTCPDMYRDPADVVAADLALAGVQPGAHLDAERLHGVADRHRAPDRALRAVEHREEAVPGGVHLAAPKPRQLRPDDGVVRVEQRVPVTIAHLGGPARRVHDVGEQHRSEHPIVGHLSLVAGEELGDLLKGRAPWFNEVVEVAPREFDVFRALYVISDVLAHCGRAEWVVGVLDDKGGNADCRKELAHVQFGHHRKHKGDGGAEWPYRERMARARETDACPGALQVHQAADGGLARIRLPGGALTAAQLAGLADASSRLGSGTLELTGRGNLQIRGITDVAAVADAIAAAGLLPSPTHERVRNIVASPLSGRAGGNADVRTWVTELDAAICAEPRLANLPGRFLFSLDDGRGDVSGLGADVGAHVLDDHAVLLLAGRDTGVRLTAREVVETLAAVAVRFVEVRGNAWRISEFADPAELWPGAELGKSFPPVTRPPVGWIEQDDCRVALGAAVPLGVLSARVAEFLAAIEAPLVVTPWRSMLVCDLDAAVADTALRVLAPLGIVFDENSPWLAVSACVGSPGCAQSIADVRADAARSLHDDCGVHRHFVGCERACGSPPTGEVLVATGDGYRPLRS
jgi:precorrin-3B synthase